MKFLAGLLAFISSFFAGDSPPPPLPPLNTAIISFQNTYYTPAVADPNNFPKAKSVVLAVQDIKAEIKPVIKIQTPIIAPSQQSPANASDASAGTDNNSRYR